MGSEARTRLALIGLLAATLFAFGEVFATSDFVGPSLLGTLVAVTIVAGARRLGLGAWASIGASIVVLVWYLALVFAADRTLYGLPTPAALSSLRAPLDSAYRAVRLDFTPVPLRTGYVVMLVTGMWLAATLGEVATFRWRRPILAALAPIGLFALVTIVGTGTGASAVLLLFLGALLSYWAFDAAQRLRSWGRGFPAREGQRAEPPDLSGALARRMGAAALAAAVVGPLFLPALGDGLLAWKSGLSGGGGPGGGRINPLVSLAPRLIDQEDRELFTVVADQPDYWRLVSLAEFDGVEWKPLRATDDVDGAELDGGGGLPLVPPGAAVRSVVQRYTISGLRGDMLPAAVQATSVRFDGDEPAVGVDVLGGLTVDELEEGIRYTVESATPALSYRTLVQAQPARAAGSLYVEIPPLSPAVRRLLATWTRGIRSPYEKLVAIQEQLRAFNYSLDVEPRASADHLTDFLTRTRTGYCQQFATAFALLGRALGYPTRVSVGFLPGSTTPADPNRFVVRGTQAHAWPEVLFSGVGWVRFEPTPRAIAAPPTHTVRASAAVDGLTGLGRSREDASQALAERFGRLETGFGSEAGVTGRLRPSGVPEPEPAVWTSAFRRLLAAIAFAVALLVGSVPAIKLWRARRRYRRARDAGATAAAAFEHFVDFASELASARAHSESASAYARRLAAAKRISGSAGLRLAAIYEAAAYGPRGVGGDEATEACRLSRQLRADLWRNASWWERAARVFSVRGLAPSR